MARFSAGREIINKKPSFRADPERAERVEGEVEESRSPAATDLDRLRLDPSATLGMTEEVSRDGEYYLIVGIEADKRVRKLKGEGRPVMGQEDRKEMLEGLKMVDEVIILPDKFDSDDDYLKLLREVKPDIYAVSENSPYLENKKKLCRAAGVVLKVVHAYNPEYSTTKLIAKLLNC